MLEDLLAPNLDIVFVGTAAGTRSSQVGHYYAGAGNRFWATLHEVGLTRTEYKPSEFRRLLGEGIGLTDLCKTQAGMDHQITEWDVEGFERKMRKANPRGIAFTSKTGAAIWLDCKTRAVALGELSPKEGFPMTMFALPSTSGAAKKTWSIGPWRDLATWAHTIRSKRSPTPSVS